MSLISCLLNGVMLLIFQKGHWSKEFTSVGLSIREWSSAFKFHQQVQFYTHWCSFFSLSFILNVHCISFPLNINITLQTDAMMQITLHLDRSRCFYLSFLCCIKEIQTSIVMSVALFLGCCPFFLICFFLWLYKYVSLLVQLLPLILSWLACL